MPSEPTPFRLGVRGLVAPGLLLAACALAETACSGEEVTPPQDVTVDPGPIDGGGEIKADLPPDIPKSDTDADTAKPDVLDAVTDAGTPTPDVAIDTAEPEPETAGEAIDDTDEDSPEVDDADATDAVADPEPEVEGEVEVEVELPEKDEGPLPTLDICDTCCPKITDVPLKPGDIIVSEVMFKPKAVDENTGEWFEIQNTTKTPIAINGLYFGDGKGIEENTVSNCKLVLPAKGALVFGASGLPAVNGGVKVDYTWNEFKLGNTQDQIVLKAGDMVLDSVAWNAQWPLGEYDGKAMSLDADKANATDNDSAWSWCAGVDPLPGGDFGSPGTLNAACPKVTDEDGDGAPDKIDNCPKVPNPKQEDKDGDKVGDVCDNCPDTPNPGQANADGDAAGDACDPVVCGDGELDLGEQCDDGNENENDGCEKCKVTAIVAQKVLISEIFVHTDSFDDAGAEWLELYNGDAKPVIINNWLLQTGKGGAFNLPATPTLTIAPGGHFVVGGSQSEAQNGGAKVHLVWKGIALDDTADTVELFNKTTPIDKIAYGTQTPKPKAGTALQVDPKYMTGTYNDIAAYWCDADVAMKFGDFGTPAVLNTTCLPAGKDKDGDGSKNELDNCPFVANPDQKDSDGDGFGDVCDNCPKVANKAQADFDNDGVGNPCDNCVKYPNPNQKDSDGDGFGDFCDSKTCGDSKLDQYEECDDGNTVPGDGCSANCLIETVEPGAMIFTEFMVKPATVGDALGEWVEVYNTTNEPIDLNGWTLRDKLSNNHKILAPKGLIVGPKAYKLLGVNGDPAQNGGFLPDYVYPFAQFSMANVTDSLVLEWNKQVVDEVSYTATGAGGQWKIEPGVSLQLDPGSYDAVKNDTAANWCLTKPKIEYAKDGKGTPGKANIPCTNVCEPVIGQKKPDKTPCGTDLHCIDGDCVPVPFCGDGKIDVELGEICDDGNKLPGDGCGPNCKPEPAPPPPGTIFITEVQVNPEAVEDTDGEWFELHNPTKAAVDITGWFVQDPVKEDGKEPDTHWFKPQCGNGRTEAQEQCDDGNYTSNDGCTSDCKAEGQCKSLKFDGQGAYVQVQDQGLFAFGPKLSVHTWVQLDSLYGNGTCTGPGPTAGACADLFSYGRDGAFRVLARVAGGKFWAVAGEEAFDLGPATTGVWTHVAVTVWKGKLRAFVNGRKLAEATLKAWPAGTKTDALTLGVSLDGANKVLHPLKGRVSGFHVATGGPSIFRRHFGPHGRWQSWKGDLVALHLDEGSGTKLADISGNNHSAAHVAAAWIDGTVGNASAPYCKVAGTLVGDTKALTPGFDAFTIPPGAYVLVVRSSNYDKNNNLDPFYSWSENLANGYYLLSNSNDGIVLNKPGPDPKNPLAGKTTLWTLDYGKGSWPWNKSVSMMLKGECWDVKLLEKPECWFAADKSCPYGEQVVIKESVGGKEVPKACGDGKATCDTAQQCLPGPGGGTYCTAIDYGTPGAPNVCGP
jgi:cysteine-rich repeat protein